MHTEADGFIDTDIDLEDIEEDKQYRLDLLINPIYWFWPGNIWYGYSNDEWN